MTWKEKTELLEQNLNFEHLFEVLCLEKENTFAIWLEDGEVKTYDYGYLQSASFATAAKVRALDFGKEGGFTGIAVDTCKDWPILFWGLLAAGRNPLLLDPSLDDAGIDHLMREAGADSLITRRRRALACDRKTPEELLCTPEECPADFAPAFADLVAACTSGTTATARVYVYNGEALCRQVIGFAHHQPYPCLTWEGAGPVRTVSFLPLNHIFGLLTNVITTPFQSYPQIYLKDRAPQTILDTCRKCGAQMILTVPLLVNSIADTLQKQLSRESAFKRGAFSVMQRISLTCQRIDPRFGLKVGKRLFRSVNAKLFGDSMMQIVLGGAHAAPEPLKLINSLGYAVTVGFGMTETCITSYENKIDLKTRLSGSVGLPLPISEYRVVPNGDDPKTGELFIRSNAMHIGKMEAGKLVAPAVDQDGWFATGDIVRLGEGDRMWIVGRAKDVIIGESGENLYPDEIEDAFAGLDGVEEMSVVGLKHDGKERVALVVYVGDRYEDEAYLTALSAEIGERNQKLRALKRAGTVLVVPQKLPIVGGIKVKRAEIARRLESGEIASKELSASGIELHPARISEQAPAAGAVAASAKLKDLIRRCFAEELEIDEALIGDDTVFTEELGGDSLHRLGALLRVENEVGVQIPEESYEQCTTVNELAAVIVRLQAGGTAVPTELPQSVTPIVNFEDAPEYREFTGRFAEMDAMQNPYFVCHESPLRDTSIMDGREVLNFGSYNYVGMSGRKEVNDAAKAAIDKYGTSASGSRLLAGEKKIHEELEAELADWKHAEDCVVLVGGHSTNVTVVGNFCKKGDLILYDALIHNSVHEGCRLSDADSKAFPHNDTAMLEEILKNLRSRYAKVLIVVEGVYSMDGDISPIPEFVRIKKQYGCFLMVDEAHSTCVIGRTGGGVDEYFGLDKNDIDIKMGTLSKGLGTCGGYIAGSRAIVEYLRYNVPGFVFSVGLSPALAAGSLAAVRLMRSESAIMENMRRNIDCFMAEAKKHHFNTCLAGKTAILPILVGSDEDAYRLSNKLSELGVIAPPAVYPAVPRGKARLRFCVISEHKPEQIARALDLLAQAADELGIRLPE